MANVARHVANQFNPAHPAGMSNYAFGAVVIAFLIYITAKGELGTYLQLFLYTAPATGGTAGTTTTGTTGTTAAPTNQGATPGLSSNPFAGLGSILNPFALPSLGMPPLFQSSPSATPSPPTAGGGT